MSRSLIFIFFCIFLLNSCVTTTTSMIGSIAVSTAKRESFKETISDTKISSVIKVRFLDKGFNELYKKIGVAFANKAALFYYLQIFLNI